MKREGEREEILDRLPERGELIMKDIRSRVSAVMAEGTYTGESLVSSTWSLGFTAACSGVLGSWASSTLVELSTISRGVAPEMSIAGLEGPWVVTE